jgi:hypothetical protein
MFGSVGVFPGCFNRLKCWLAYQLPVLHVLLPSVLQRSSPPLGHARTSYYTLHTIPNTLLSFLLNFCSHFIYFSMSFLCYLCETCSVVDLFLSESSKTTDFKFATSNLSFMQIKFSVRLSFGMRYLIMFKHFEVICCLYIQTLSWKWKQQDC